MISVLMTSCAEHLPLIKQAVESVCDHADFLILAYDSRGELPPVEVVRLCDVFISGIPKGKQPGETFSLKHGLGCARDRDEYVLKITGDSVLERPEGIKELPTLLGDNDCISVQWNAIGGTLIFFGRSEKLHQAIRNIPEVNHPQIEKRLYYSMMKLGMKHKIYPMEHEQGVSGRNGKWGEILGYHHVHREVKYREEIEDADKRDKQTSPAPVQE